MKNIKSFYFIGFVALIMIITSNFMQYYNNLFFLILNIGFQLLFIIIGFLCGNKKIENFKEWFKLKFKKIGIPFYIYILLSFIIILIFSGDFLILKDLWKYLLLIQGFFGPNILLGHLWFITFIIICYLIVPLLQKFDFSNDKPFVFYLKLAGILLFLLVIENLTLFYKFTSNMFCFISAYYFARRYFYNKLEIRKSFNILKYLNVLLFPIILTAFALLQTIDFDGSNFYFLLTIGKQILPFLLAVSLFLMLSLFFDFLYNKKREPFINKLLKFSNTYAYYIYLTHSLFIIGAVSLMTLTSYNFLNVVFILTATMIYSLVLKFLTNKINTYLICKSSP